jgi:hypothetical protein
VVEGSVMNEMILISPPQTGHTSGIQLGSGLLDRWVPWVPLAEDTRNWSCPGGPGGRRDGLWLARGVEASC